MERPPPVIADKESQPKPLFKVILMRHEETEYTGVGRDLTDKGIEGAKKTGRKLKDDDFFPNKDEVISLYSPKHRTKGTLDFVLEEAGISKESRPVNVLVSSKIVDAEAFERHAEEEMEGDSARTAEAFYTHDIHKNHPEIIEPHLKKKERLYRAMEYLIRFAMKTNNSEQPTTQQILAVSHFEIITHLIDDVFGIKNTGYRSPSFGEQVKISAFQTKDPDKILLDVIFRNLKKQVLFNRKTRSIEIIVH